MENQLIQYLNKLTKFKIIKNPELVNTPLTDCMEDYFFVIKTGHYYNINENFEIHAIVKEIINTLNNSGKQYTTVELTTLEPQEYISKISQHFCYCISVLFKGI